ncbi:hypothetical protein [Silvimonas sp.]|uniref:hypothetical protein n=1 Tax=Silvimonas sp. TaxID=2650811 RepID=UPI0028489504|nr:hypothetical protein [Silvimonas sp.]MDR3427797.1 hypothetical protein [Silvimonas sp.]
MSNRIFSHDAYKNLLDQTVTEIVRLSKLKGGEYAGDTDRLANFRRNGEQLDLPMEKCWAVYYNKHHDAVMQYIRDLSTGKGRQRLEPLGGRIDDMIVYLILFKAMLVERGEHELPTPSRFPDPSQSAKSLSRFSDPSQSAKSLSRFSEAGLNSEENLPDSTD